MLKVLEKIYQKSPRLLSAENLVELIWFPKSFSPEGYLIVEQHNMILPYKSGLRLFNLFKNTHPLYN